MNQARSIGVAEARFGLTVLTCLLVVLGYVVLQRLGGTGQTVLVETRPLNTVEPITAPPKLERPEQPEVIKVETTVELPTSTVPRTTLRPQLPPRQAPQ
jgi:hypothetical protein